MAYTEVPLKSKDIQISVIQRTLVMGQHIDTFAFRIPKVWGLIDLSEAIFYMKYELPSGAKFRDLLKTEPGGVSDATMLVIWTPDSTNATSENGNLKIQLDAAILIAGTTYCWESKIASINVANNIVTEEEALVTSDLFVEMQAYFLAMKDLSVAAQEASELAQVAAENASAEAYASQLATQEQAGLASSSAIIASQKAASAEAARIAAVDAYNSAFAAMNTAGSLVGSLESLSAAVLSTEQDALDAEADAVIAVAAKDLAVTAKDDAVTAKEATLTAKGEVIALYGDAQAIAAAKTAAETAETNAETAETNAVTAKTASEAAATNAISAKNDAVTAKTAALAAQAISTASKDMAVLAVGAAETARDAILNNTGYQSVLSELAVDGDITIVAESIADVSIVAADIGTIRSVYAHPSKTDNPHAVTRTQVGLGTSDSPEFANFAAKSLYVAGVTDLNNVSKNGFYSVQMNTANKPVEIIGNLIVSGAGSIVAQQYYPFDRAEIYFRSGNYSNYTWSDWKQVADTASVNMSVDILKGAGWADQTVKQNADELSVIDTRVQVLENLRPKIYGFKKHKLSGACTPLYDSVALGPIPVIRGTRAVDFVNPYNNINIFHWRSCLMTTKQQILAYYGQAGYDTPTADSQSYEVEIPKAYIKQWEDADYTYRIMSESLVLDGMFVPGAFRDNLGQEMPFAYVDKYRRGVLNGFSVSRPDILPEVSQNIIQFETKAEAIDTTMLWTGSPEELDWYITYVAEIMACDTNSQTAYGQGMSSMPYSASHVVTAVTTDANTVIVSNATANAFKPTINVKLGTALGNGQTFNDRLIVSITDNGDGNSTVVVDGAPFTTVLSYVLHAHRQVTTLYESEEIGEDSGFILHDGRPETQVENWINGIAGHGGNVYEFSFGVLRYDNYVYLCHDRYQFKHNDDPRTNPAYKLGGFFEQTDGTYGWIKNMVLVGNPPYVMEWIQELGAGSTTHYGDVAYYLAPDWRGTKVLRRRLSWPGGSWCGRRTVSGSYSLASANWSIGWRASPSKLVKLIP